MLASTIYQLLLPFFLPSWNDRLSPPSSDSSYSNTFTLRQSHTTHPSPQQKNLIVFSQSAHLDSPSIQSAPLHLKKRKIKVQKPWNSTFYSNSQWRRSRARADYEYEVEGLGWDEVEVDAPDVTDRETVLTLAKMTSNAYTLPDDTKGWYPLHDWNNSVPIGWEPNADRLRGHIFANDDNSTVIISIKGTSAGIWGSGGPTAKNDRIQDNLLFCCCARVDFSWSTVCDCYSGSYQCGATCVQDALIEESLYYPIGTNLYNNVTVMYPNANIWMVGHSLGGGLAALTGATFGLPVVAFESPGDRLAAQRLHLPLPPGGFHDGIIHVYNTADPIPTGTCTGTLSTCYAAGFALETGCHLGKSIIYDTVTKKGWSVDIRAHRISDLITRVLHEDWNDGEGPPKVKSYYWPWGGGGGNNDTTEPAKNKTMGPPVPVAEYEEDCVDCFKWEFSDDFEAEKKKKKKKDGE